MIKVVVDDPPNIAQIAKVFPRRPERVVYAYGDTIYVPQAKRPVRKESEEGLAPYIVQHEEAHLKRQHDPELWWRRYLEEPEFRYNEEVIGHAAEYRWFAVRTKDREERVRLLQRTARRLIAPFYEYNVTFNKAFTDLKRHTT